MSVNTGGAGSAEMRELGAALRKLREARSMTTRVLGEQIGMSTANISHWENGARLISAERLDLMLDALQPDDDERDRLLGLHRKANGPGELVAGQTTIGQQLVQLIEYEQVATRLTDVAPLMIPGLLQTESYARAAFEGLSAIPTRVALRLGRQKILTRPHEPAELVAYLDSEALTRPIADGQVMVDQWRHLLEMSQRPNITIRLVSSTSRGYNPMLAGPFLMLEFPAASPVVHLEHHRTAAFLWEEEDVRGFAAAVDRIDEMAMTPAQTAEVIAEIVNGTEST